MATLSGLFANSKPETRQLPSLTVRGRSRRRSYLRLRRATSPRSSEPPTSRERGPAPSPAPPPPRPPRTRSLPARRSRAGTGGSWAVRALVPARRPPPPPPPPPPRSEASVLCPNGRPGAGPAAISRRDCWTGRRVRGRELFVGRAALPARGQSCKRPRSPRGPRQPPLGSPAQPTGAFGVPGLGEVAATPLNSEKLAAPKLQRAPSACWGATIWSPRGATVWGPLPLQRRRLTLYPSVTAVLSAMEECKEGKRRSHDAAFGGGLLVLFYFFNLFIDKGEKHQ